MKNNTSTSTIQKDQIAEKVYWVLKKKAVNVNEIVRQITEETCNRLEEWLELNIESLDEKLKDFDDPKKAFECIILKKLIAILAQMEKEYKGKLSDKDLQTYKDLIQNSKSEMQDGDDNNGKDFEQADRKVKSGKNLDY